MHSIGLREDKFSFFEKIKFCIMINLIYILIFLILIFVGYFRFKAVSYGIQAKQKNRVSKNIKFKKKNITNDLLKINNLYKTGAITKKEFQKAKKKILDN